MGVGVFKCHVSRVSCVLNKSDPPAIYREVLLEYLNELSERRFCLLESVYKSKAFCRFTRRGESSLRLFVFYPESVLELLYPWLENFSSHLVDLSRSAGCILRERHRRRIWSGGQRSLWICRHPDLHLFSVSRFERPRTLCF